MPPPPLNPPPGASVAEVVQTLQAIEQALPDDDGLKWFNHLYLAVTEAVAARIGAGTFIDPAWISHLDVVFANYYFAAVRASAGGADATPPAWRPLFETRFDSGIARIQFALAGMNAHINRDLVVSLIDTHDQLGTTPDRDSDHFRDFVTVNAILSAVEAQVKAELLTDVLRAIDGSLGSLDDVLAMWSVERARDAAWTNSEAMWAMRIIPPVADAFFDRLDHTIGFAGRGLLIPTQLAIPA